MSNYPDRQCLSSERSCQDVEGFTQLWQGASELADMRVLPETQEDTKESQLRQRIDEFGQGVWDIMDMNRKLFFPNSGSRVAKLWKSIRRISNRDYENDPSRNIRRIQTSRGNIEIELFVELGNLKNIVGTFCDNRVILKFQGGDTIEFRARYSKWNNKSPYGMVSVNTSSVISTYANGDTYSLELSNSEYLGEKHTELRMDTRIDGHSISTVIDPSVYEGSIPDLSVYEEAWKLLQSNPSFLPIAYAPK